MIYYPITSQILLIIILLVGILLVLLNKIRMDLVALLIAAILGILQLLGFGIIGPAGTPSAAINVLAGFSQPVLITIISLFALTITFEKSGANYWIAGQLINLGGKNTSRFILLFSITSAALSLIMNNFAAGALLLPSALEVSYRTKINPSKLLIPIAYGSLLGGTATYFTTANMVMSDLLTKTHPPQTPLGFFDFFASGGLIAVLGIAFLYFWGDKLLPNHQPDHDSGFLYLTGSQLEDFYQIGDRLWEASVLPDSPLANQTIAQANIGRQWGLAIAAVIRDGEYILPVPSTILEPGRILLLIGREEKIIEIRKMGITVQPHKEKTYLSAKGIGIIELILSPHSKYVGKTVAEIHFREKFGGTIIGIKRTDRSYRTDVGKLPLNSGDSLLIVGNQNQLNSLEKFNDFIMIKPHLSDQPVNKKSAILTLSLLGIVIILSAFQIPVYLSMLVAAIVLIMLNKVSLDEIYSSIQWQAIFIIAGMFVVSISITETGLANQIADHISGLLNQGNLIHLSFISFLVSAAITQLVGGQVAAFIAGPITLGAAINSGINTHAIAVATAIGCSASFLLPLAHPVNIMMIGPGNYRMKDFIKVGVWLTLVSMLGLIIAMVIFWR